MICIPNEESPLFSLLLEVTLQTQGLIPLRQHPLIHRSVRRMASYAPFAHRLVLVNERTSLRGVTLEAGFVLAHERDAAALKLLGKAGPAALHDRADMRIMAIDATDFPFHDRMVMGQLEVGPHFQVALETGLRRFARIDNRLAATAALNVQASRPVTRFATGVLGILSRRFQPGVRGGGEITGDRLVAGRASLGADKVRPGNAGWSEDGVGGAA